MSCPLRSSVRPIIKPRMAYSTYTFIAAHVTAAMVGCAMSIGLLLALALASMLRSASKSATSSTRIGVELVGYIAPILAAAIACLPVPYLFLTLHIPLSAGASLVVGLVASAYWFIRRRVFGQVTFVW